MNQIAYTLFIAFVSSLLTLGGIVWLSPDRAARAEASPRVVSLEELTRHDSAESCWKAIDGRVYDITAYIEFHPTDPEVVTDWCGKVATDAWYDKGDGRPHSARATAMLADYFIGLLEGAQISEPLIAVPSAAGKPALASTGAYRDGTYYAESEPDGRGWISIVEISVHRGRIIAVYYDEIQRNEAGEVTQRKSADLNYAQRWRRVSGGVTQLTAFPAYAQQLVNTGTPDGVDALSGATGAYEGFRAMAREALSQATP